MLITKEKILDAIERAPAIKPVLARLAKRAAAGKPLPETFSATGLDYAAQRELESLFGTVGKRTADGRVYISVMPPRYVALSGFFSPVSVSRSVTFHSPLTPTVNSSGSSTS